ncbi:MAG: hybrid sensor histidine kinase/response regulator [Clostridia bacterium]|nr:hybrid sensor histidine kinase/response regulator [Clostridia bacterium]NCC43388.1 hybrid sensor histidine kinase/response regulator [Clostridia bacterium]
MKQYKLLIVDDIEMNRAMLLKIFSEDYICFWAENGKRAMDILGQNEIALVLLDLSMPEMDGYEVIAAMRADQRLAAIPIVITTGAPDRSERRALDLGADDYVEKPYDPYIVKKRVENLLQKYVLQVANLQQALGHAEQLNRAKSAFLSRMSHELRSPINSIISLAALQKEHTQEPEVMEDYSEKFESSAKYLLGVINDILNMSAIENQKVVIAKSPFNFRKLVEGTAAMFYSQCREKSITFSMNLVNFTEEFLFGDPQRLKEILINLLSNAVKFTADGGNISVRVSQVSRVAHMVKLKFEVTDDGEGIAPERQEAIFLPFVQESGDTLQKHGGTGLGLPIVKNIVDLMGGTIEVNSSKGAGSTFTVILPFTVAKEMPEMDTERLKEVRALIIDDDKETQEYGRTVLKKMGIQCDIAESGELALGIMRKAFEESKGYDICFVDWRMPGMSGIDITRAIRAQFDDDTVIVVASAYDMEEITEEATMAGANMVVPKPMFQSTVFDLLMNITGGQYQQKEQNVQSYCFDGKKALIVEDNTLNAEVLRELIGMVGFTSERAVDGKEACEKFESSPVGTYDVILMDIQMPIMNGHEAARYIRACAQPQAKSVPMIAVTANAFTEDVKASLESGMNDHLAKPIDSERLYKKLARHVGQTVGK